MAEKIELKKTVTSRPNFEKVVNNSFTTFVDPVIEVTELTVDEFFAEYERLFYEIPIEGDVNSHQYLIQRSGQLAIFEQDTQDIQPLLEEIALLREELLIANQTILELQTPVVNEQ
jgi:hypothetical protein